MKKIFITALTLIFCYNCFAQDPQLFKNTWYLQKVVIEDIEYFPPGINGEGVIIPLEFNEFPGEVGTSVCNVISSSCTYSSTESLITTLGDWTIFGFECDNNENLAFANLYYTSIWHLSINQSFDLSYLIENDGDNKKLTITNNEGNQAIYGNVLLAIPNFENSFFTIYPNPASDQLYITSENYVIENVTIYSALGKKVIELENFDTSIDVSYLSEGMYFIEVSTSKGKSVQKFIKE